MLFILLTLYPVFSCGSQAGTVETISTGTFISTQTANIHLSALGAQDFSPADKALLLSALLKKVVIDKHLLHGERALIDSALLKLLDSCTARELARQFVKENARASLWLEKSSEVAKTYLSGQKEIGLSGAKTIISIDPPKVSINWKFSETNPDNMPASLAHELFGHVLEKKRAKRFGITNKIYSHHYNEELNAGLIGWIVSAELQMPVSPSAWEYVDNPSGYSSSFLSCNPAYTLRLLDDEVRAPCSAYQKRLDGISKCIEENKQQRDRTEKWLKIIDHLIEVHKIEAASFDPAKRALYSSMNGAQNDAIDLPALATELHDMIYECPGRESQAWIKNFAEKSKSIYFQELRQRVAERTEILSSLLLGKTGHMDPSLKPEGPWDKLVALWGEHAKSGSCNGWYPK